MAIEINWSLLQPVDIPGAFQQGLQNGQHMAREAAVEGALRDYTDTGGVISENPDADPAAMERRRKAEGVLAAYAPDRLQTLSALELQRTKTAAALAEQQAKTRIGALAQTDPAAAANEALGAGEFELAKTLRELGKPDQEKVHKRAEAAAPIAYQALKLPADQRPGFIASNRDYLIASGFSPQELDAFDPSDAALQNIVIQASTLEQLRGRDEVKYIPVNEGARLVGVDSFGRPIDPGAVNPPQGALGGGGTATAGGGGSGGGLTIERQNNPGALRVPGSTEFQRFNSPAEGVAAQQRQLGLYFRRGTNTVSSVIEKWSPRTRVGGDNSDASVNNYISYVADRLGVQPGEKLAPSDIPKLASAMAEFETGRRNPKSGKTNNQAKVKADAEAAIAAGADPVKVKARAAEMGVNL